MALGQDTAKTQGPGIFSGAFFVFDSLNTTCTKTPECKTRQCGCHRRPRPAQTMEKEVTQLQESATMVAHSFRPQHSESSGPIACRQHLCSGQLRPFAERCRTQGMWLRQESKRHTHSACIPRASPISAVDPRKKRPLLLRHRPPKQGAQRRTTVAPASSGCRQVATRGRLVARRSDPAVAHPPRDSPNMPHPQARPSRQDPRGTR